MVDKGVCKAVWRLTGRLTSGSEKVCRMVYKRLSGVQSGLTVCDPVSGSDRFRNCYDVADTFVCSRYSFTKLVTKRLRGSQSDLQGGLSFHKVVYSI